MPIKTKAFMYHGKKYSSEPSARGGCLNKVVGEKML